MPETTTTTVVVEQHTIRIPESAKELIEALIFAAEEPLRLEQIRKIYQESAVEERRDVKENEIEAVISVLNDEFQRTHKPYRIVPIAGGYQFSTLPDYAEWIGKLYKEQGRRKLSQSSLETLSIIAYRQPIIRPDIEAIRGVDCDYVLGTLLEKKLITIVGRAPTPGRPLLYGTTEHFLKHFGLNHITDLPKPREIEELLADSRYETERRMLEAQEQAEKTTKEDEDFKSRLPHIPKKKADLDDAASIVHRESRSLHVKKTEDLVQPVIPETKEPEADSQDLDSSAANETQERLAAESLSPAAETLEPPTIQNPEQDADQNTDVAERNIIVPLNFIPANFPAEVPDEPSSTEAQLDEHAVEDGQTEAQEISSQAQEPSVIEADESTGTAAPIEESVITEFRLIESVEQPLQEETKVVKEVEQEAGPELASEVENIVPPTVEPVENQLEEVNTELPQLLSEVPEQIEEVSSDEDTESIQTESEQVNEEIAPTHIPEVAVPPIVEVTESTHPVTPPFIAPIVDEVRDPTQPTGRWQLIKDRIQGFIKKVFG